MVHCCHLPQQQRAGVQGGSRNAGLLCHALHHLCLYQRCHADVPTAARDRGRAGRASDVEGPDHHAVRQPLAALHPLLLTGGLLSHPGLLRKREMKKGRVKENMKKPSEARGMDGLENQGYLIDLSLPSFTQQNQ